MKPLPLYVPMAYILSNVIANQTIHEAYGGVVPELASRVHQQNIVPAVQQSLLNAKLSKNDIDAVAFTRGPGLLGSLLVGVSFAKAFALARNIPLIEINHMQAHVLAHFIDEPKAIISVSMSYRIGRPYANSFGEGLF